MGYLVNRVMLLECRDTRSAGPFGHSIPRAYFSLSTELLHRNDTF